MNRVKSLLFEDQTGRVFIDEFDQFYVEVVDKDDPDRRTGTIPSDIRGLSCPICEESWSLKPREVMDQHWSMALDAVIHMSCYEKVLRYREIELFMDAVKGSNFSFSKVEKVPNEYSAAWNLPWYKFHLHNLEGATLTLGCRKRVYVVELRYPKGEASPIKDPEKEFDKEQVTKSFNQGVCDYQVMLHAWDNEKLKDYVSRISQLFDLNDERGRVTSSSSKGTTYSLR